MSISTSRGSYKDCFDVWQAALDDEQGARVKMADFDAAVHFRMRLHTARAIDRRDNAAIYPVGDQMHGTSVYDGLIIRIKNINDEIYVYAEQLAIEAGALEPLSQVKE